MPLYTIIPEAGPKAELCGTQNKELPAKLTALKSKAQDRQRSGLTDKQAKKEAQRTSQAWIYKHARGQGDVIAQTRLKVE